MNHRVYEKKQSPESLATFTTKMAFLLFLCIENWFDGKSPCQKSRKDPLPSQSFQFVVQKVAAWQS